MNRRATHATYKEEQCNNAGMADTTILCREIHFAEGPRWHNDEWYYSDMQGKEVRAVREDGTQRVVATIPNQPSGLGWLPDGRMLVVSMLDRKVLRQESDGTLAVHADLSGMATWHANDMIVLPNGDAYIGNFGFDLHGHLHDFGVERVLADAPKHAAVLAYVKADGSVYPVADDLLFPNGMVVVNNEQGSRLVVAETLGLRLTCFDLSPDGTTSNRSIWADLAPNLVAPDGIALDPSGAIWVANALAPEALLIGEGGAIIRRVNTTQNCYAVAVGGIQGNTLLCCTAPDSDPAVVAPSKLGNLEISPINL